MYIYVVKPGDTLDSIASMFGVSIDKLILENELTEPSQLVPGQMLVIVYPTQTHTVQEGESLESISDLYNITTSELLRNNYGTRKIKKKLDKKEYQVSRKRIGRIMKKYGLVSNYTVKQYKVHKSKYNEEKTKKQTLFVKHLQKLIDP